jgi:hypothetical protein
VLSLGFILMLALLLPGAWPIYILCIALLWAAALPPSWACGSSGRALCLPCPLRWPRCRCCSRLRAASDRLERLGRTVTITTTGTERLLSIVVKSWLSVQVA